MSPSPEAIAIQTPLSVVADLFARSSQEAKTGSSTSSEDFYARVRDYFSSVLADHVDSIPLLEDTHSQGKLARFRCMVQDTGLPNEVFVLDVGGENGRGCCAYSEGAASGSPILGAEMTDYSKLRERQVIYATSIPGETDWHKSKCTSESTSRNNETDALASELSSRLSVGGSSSASTSGSSLANKFPLPGVAHTGALVKIYPTSPSGSGSSATDSVENAKATKIVDFVGVVDFSPFPSSSSLEESPSNDQASSSQLPEQVKTLHAIYRVPAPSPERSERLATPATARQDVIDQLAAVLEGDKLAAEWLLLALLGKIHTRRGALALGQLPINLVLPSSTDDTAGIVKRLQEVLQNLLPRLVKLDFNIPELNKVKYLPESKEENLISGVLQLPQGTTVLVDETIMGEGNLQDRGVKNIQALATVLKDQTLAYVFPYSSFTFETDLTLIVVSKGKSLLPIDCVVQVRPSSIPSTASPTPSDVQLAAWRDLLGASSQADKFVIPEDVSEHIQSDFVRMRQNKSVTQEDLVLRMTVARLLATSHGKTTLDIGTWEATRDLDEARKARIGK